MDVPLPTSDQKSASTSYQVCLPRPPDFFQESSSKTVTGFCGVLSSRERPNWASPLTIVHMFLSKIKRYSERFCPKQAVTSRTASCEVPGRGRVAQGVSCERADVETLGVSLSGYSAWKKRPMSEHQREDQQLAEHIEEVSHSCRQVYGSPRIHAELRGEAHHDLPQAGGASDARTGMVCLPAASSDDHDQK